MGTPTRKDPTPSQFAAYQAMYGYFNKRLFAGTLPPVILNFSRHANSYGFFAPERWGRASSFAHASGKLTAKSAAKSPPARTHEISINPTHLATRPLRDTAATLVHEMCHLWQQDFGTPPRRGYHDTEWATKMVAVGLQPIDLHTGQPRMSAHALSHVIMVDGAFARAFDRMPRGFHLPWTCAEITARVALPPAGKTAGTDGEESEPEPAAPKVKSKNKYTCPTCSASVWGKPDLHIVCGADGARYAMK